MSDNLLLLGPRCSATVPLFINITRPSSIFAAILSGIAESPSTPGFKPSEYIISPASSIREMGIVSIRATDSDCIAINAKCTIADRLFIAWPSSLIVKKLIFVLLE